MMNNDFVIMDGVLVKYKGKEASLVIPWDVTAIGERAFALCFWLTSIMLPHSVTDIGYAAFLGCVSLKSIVIPDSVRTIGGNAFAYCGLTSVTIPDSVTAIGEDAFKSCEKLTSVAIPGSVADVGKAAFMDCGRLTTVSIGNGVTRISREMFWNCLGLTAVTLPDSLTGIDRMAFHGCKSLTSIAIPEGVASIGHWAFYGCERLNCIAVSRPDLLDMEDRPSAAAGFAEHPSAPGTPRYAAHMKYIRENIAAPGLIDAAVRHPALLSLLFGEGLLTPAVFSTYLDHTTDVENTQATALLLDFQHRLGGGEGKPAELMLDEDWPGSDQKGKRPARKPRRPGHIERSKK